MYLNNKRALNKKKIKFLVIGFTGNICVDNFLQYSWVYQNFNFIFCNNYELLFNVIIL